MAPNRELVDSESGLTIGDLDFRKVDGENKTLDFFVFKYLNQSLTALYFVQHLI